jgi:hypothetical protein
VITSNYQGRRVKTEVCEITQIRIVNSEISEDDDDNEDGNADTRRQRIDADEEHQTFFKSSTHLKKKEKKSFLSIPRNVFVNIAVLFQIF